MRGGFGFPQSVFGDTTQNQTTSAIRSGSIGFDRRARELYEVEYNPRQGFISGDSRGLWEQKVQGEGGDGEGSGP